MLGLLCGSKNIDFCEEADVWTETEVLGCYSLSIGELVTNVCVVRKKSVCG